jgi:hypothetical protein
MSKRKLVSKLPQWPSGMGEVKPYAERTLAESLKDDLKFARMRLKDITALLAEVEANPEAERIINLYRKR